MPQMFPMNWMFSFFFFLSIFFLFNIMNYYCYNFNINNKINKYNFNFKKLIWKW